MKTRFRRRVLHLGAAAAALLFLGGLAPAQTATPSSRPGDADRFLTLFQPTQTDLATLSPDGLLLAYTRREQDIIAVVIVEVDHPAKVKARVLVVDDARATPRFDTVVERTPASVRWMRWVSNTRLVVETNAQASVSATRSLPGTVLAFDADGGNAKLLLNARSLEENVPAAVLDRGTRDRKPLGATVDDPNFGRDSSGGNLDTTGAPPQQLPGLGFEEPSGVLFSPIGVPAEAGAQSDPADTRFAVISRPLVPSVFDLDPATPGAVLVRAIGAASYLVYSLDTVTGKVRLRSDYTYNPEQIPLYDRQGVPRISVPSTTVESFPHRYRLERGPGAKLFPSLDQIPGFPQAAAFQVSPQRHFLERAVPIGFDERPEILYYASNLGRDTFGLYSLDLSTGKPTEIAVEHPRLDLIPQPDGAFVSQGTLVYDRYTRKLVGLRVRDTFRTGLWLIPQLQAIQDALVKSLPGRNIDVLEWDASGRRFLAAVSGPSDAGGFVVFDTTTMKAMQFARRAPWLDTRVSNQTASVTLGGKTSPALVCQLTLSRQAKVKPMPLIVVCPSAPWERIPTEFQPEVQALADMGFAVLQLDGRGAWGSGVRRRERIHEGYAAAQADDIVQAIEGLAKAFTLDLRRVGIIGAGYGGHVALRTVQRHPGRFRCAVALDAPVNLERWLSEDRWTTRAVAPQLVRSYYGTPEELQNSTLLKDNAAMRIPFYFLAYPGKDGDWRRTSYLESKRLASALRGPEVPVEQSDLSEEFIRGLPKARAAVYRDIELFFNTYLYDFTVKVGDLEVKDDAPAPVPTQPKAP